MLGWARVRTTSGRVYATTTRLTTSRGRLAVPARFRTRGNGPARTLDRPVHLARPGSARAGTAPSTLSSPTDSSPRLRTRGNGPSS